VGKRSTASRASVWGCYEGGGTEPGIAAAAEASAAAALADLQATWCAGKAPAGEIRAVGKQ
jgi:hypothetical protein